MNILEEGCICPECRQSKLIYGVVENCSCHIAPPCDACVSNPLRCKSCGWEYEAPSRALVPTDICGIFSVIYPNRRKIHVFKHGGRIMDWDYDSSSGSTMEYHGKYNGPVTNEDILEYFGSGTFGHRGPFLHGGRFTFTKITD